jgi:hypothetical protein
MPKSKAVEKLLTPEKVEKAIKEGGGFISFASEKLGVPASVLRKYIKDSKKLRELIFELRESWVDIAEESLANKVLKGDITSIIFTLKCLGKDRGWIDRPDLVKAGGSEKAPLFIRLLPVGNMEGVTPIPKRGRPRKDDVVQQALPSTTDKEQQIIDAEYFDSEIIE